MKEMNRREFLTLSGAAVVALSLAGCGGPSAPAAPTGKEAELVAAINKVWKEKFGESKVDHEQLTLSQEAQEALKIQGGIFEKAQETEHRLTKDDMIELGKIAGWEVIMEEKYGLGGAAGISEPSGDGVLSLTFEYSCDDAAVRTFVEALLNSNSNDRKAEYISIYCPVVQGKTYMVAAVFWNKTA